MITDRIKQLAVLKAKAASLEAKINNERTVALAALPAQFGFHSVEAFGAAVRAAVGRRGPRKSNGNAKSKAHSVRRKRAIITDTTRAELKKLVEAGKSGTQIASLLKISLPSVQNIKKALGLVRVTKK